jgi:hypothetical protein
MQQRRAAGEHPSGRASDSRRHEAIQSKRIRASGQGDAKENSGAQIRLL